ncbi:MAG: DUF3341 domain-containing protein [Bacteroidales bacterium]|jgi:hypothetical protein|nr:DUF3341 domain-containing protein [Bacteroidales bacterium]
MNKDYITAYYYDEDVLLKAVRQLKEKGLEVLDVLTPFPVHGLDKALGMRRSRLTRVAFWGGAIGAAVGFLFQAWVFTKGYPLNFGGKPFFAVPSFMPVTFELAVLFAAFSMVFAFLIYFKLGPGAKTVIHDERITDDRFLVVIGVRKEGNQQEIEQALKETGAEGITHNV